MTDLFDKLTYELDDTWTVYDLAHIRATAQRCIDLEPGLLAVSEDDGAISFVVFSWHSGPSTRDGVIVDGEKMEHVFHGRGYSGSLRELRHTYWGDTDHATGGDGYIHLPNGRLITNALAALREWFDLD